MNGTMPFVSTKNTSRTAVAGSPRRVIHRNKAHHSQSRHPPTGQHFSRPTLARSKSDVAPSQTTPIARKHLVDYSRTRATHKSAGNRSPCRGPMMSRNVYHPSPATRKSGSAKLNWNVLSSNLDISDEECDSVNNPFGTEEDQEKEATPTKSCGRTAQLRVRLAMSASIGFRNNEP